MTPTRHFIRLGRLSVHYLAWGQPDRPPLILLHGGAAHAHWWDHIAPVLSHRYRVLAPDLRGHGDTDWAGPGAYEIDDYVSDLHDLIGALNLDRPILMGHSLGGFIALAYALSRRSRPRALIVVDMRARLTDSRFMRLVRALPAPSYRDEAELLRRFRLLPADSRPQPALFRAIARHSVRPAPDGRLRLKSDRAALRRAPVDLGPRLSELGCPCLFVRGQNSATLSARGLAEMRAGCPDASAADIPGAGHHVFLDQPAAFVAAVQKFLDERLRT